jgi:hypothetical protein
MSSKTYVISGSRTLTQPKQKEAMWTWLDKHIPDPKKALFIFGDAAGIDTYMHQWCDLRGYPHEEPYVPVWAVYGNAAGVVRNTQMLRDAEKTPPVEVLIFWDGTSPGSKNMIKQAGQFHLPHKVLIWAEGVKAFISHQKRLFE